MPLKLVKREINNPTKVNMLHKQTEDDENDDEDEGDAIYSNTSDETDSESDDVDCEIESRMAVGHRSRVPSSASTLTCPGDVSSCLSASTFLALPRLLSHTLTQVGRVCRIPLVSYHVSQSPLFPSVQVDQDTNNLFGSDHNSVIRKGITNGEFNFSYPMEWNGINEAYFFNSSSCY